MTNITVKIDENAGTVRRDARLLDRQEAVRCGSCACRIKSLFSGLCIVLAITGIR